MSDRIVHHEANDMRTADNRKIVVGAGRVFATLRSKRFTAVERDGVEPILPFVNGSNWWAISPVTAPESILRLYGVQLALDLFEYIGNGGPIDGALARVMQSMPVEKGPVELEFIEQVQRFVIAATILPSLKSEKPNA